MHFYDIYFHNVCGGGSKSRFNCGSGSELFVLIHVKV